MPDIAEFLAAQLDEDEQTARLAAEAGRRADPRYRWIVEPFVPETPASVPTGAWVNDEHEIGVAVVNGSYAAEHIARHDPARVLAEVATKRRIIELHEMSRWTWKHQPGVYELPEGFEGPLAEYCTTCSTTSREGLDNFYEPWPCDTLKLLAVPHAGQPGYKDQWRP